MESTMAIDINPRQHHWYWAALWAKYLHCKDGQYKSSRAICATKDVGRGTKLETETS